MRTDLSLGEWIIQPKLFETALCIGRCPGRRRTQVCLAPAISLKKLKPNLALHRSKLHGQSLITLWQYDEELF